MPFYILVNGHPSQHQFEYLQQDSGQRLEKTLVPGQKQEPFKERRKKTYAIEVMSRGVQTLDEKEPVHKAIHFFKSLKIHHIPIVQNQLIKGMISDRDILWLEKFDLSTHSIVKDFMNKTVLCCDEETPIDFIAKVMVKEVISALPVLNQNHELSGIITHHDILRWIYD